MDQTARIWVAGADTLIGGALRRELARQGYANLVAEPGRGVPLDDPSEVDAFVTRAAPEYVFVAAGRSGGIGANQRYPAELMRDNLLAAIHIVHSAYRHGVMKLLYLASSCTYPRHASQPMRVDALLTGALEPTSEAYAIAKIAGIKLCQAYRRQYGVSFISGIPADAFGPGDDFSPEDAHVAAALIHRMHRAKVAGAEVVEIWGSGGARREFVFADDLADSCILAMRAYDGAQPINLGGGTDLSIGELAELVREVVGYRGALRFDTSRPDGAPAKRLDSGVLVGMGWRPRTSLRAALAATYAWFLEMACESPAVAAPSRATGPEDRS